MRKLCARAHDERGQTYAAPVGVLLIAVLAVVILYSGLTVFSGSRANGATTTPKTLLIHATRTVHRIAAAHGGSYASVSLLNLHKVGGIQTSRSSAGPWVSAASGTVSSYHLTVTSPNGAQFNAAG